MLNKRILVLMFLLVFLLLAGCFPSRNEAPIITSTPGDTAIVGVEYTYTITATDPEGDPIIYSLVSGPTGMTFDGIATISWMPTGGQVGAHDVTVEASDGKKATIQSFTITVSEPEPEPEVELDHIVVSPKTMDLTVILAEPRPTDTIDSVIAYYNDETIAAISLDKCTYDSYYDDVAEVKREGTVVTVIATVEIVGTHFATIIVTYGGKTDTIDVTVTVLSDDATLKSLTVSPGELVEGFNPETISYTVALDAGVTSIIIIPTATDGAATITVNEVAVASGVPIEIELLIIPGENTINIVVTAEDGVAIKTYTVIVTTTII